ncbi:MAG TPA: DALR anticodon-binding domain-containing protein [Streptosporangiaceae bacterium]
MIAAELRTALAAAATEAGFPGHHPDAGLRDGGIPGRYTSSLPLRLASSTGPGPAELATRMAAALSHRGDISDVAVTGNGYLTITVTGDALGGLAVRMAEAGAGSARSGTLRGTTVPAPPGKDLAAAPSWAEAHRLITAQVTARLAEAAGATIDVHDYPERGGARVPSPDDVPRTRTIPVAQAIDFAGADAVVCALARTPPERPAAPDPAAWARHVPANPAYAVRYAHSCAASTLRWAAALGLSRGEAAAFRPGSLAHPRERALLAALSWLPERAAQAARRGRPHEFTGYLEDLAQTYQECREAWPAWPERGHEGARDTGRPEDARTVRARLWLTGAAAAGLAAGLGLLGVSAPDRL